MPFKLIYLPRTEVSTQDEARRIVSEPGDETSLTAVYTFFQQSGRGYAGNCWFGGKDRNIAATCLLHPIFLPAEHLFWLDIALSLAVLRYAREIHPGFLLKWPNDIYWNQRKFGGILIETQVQDGYVQRLGFGIGLNINESNFPETLPNPVSAKEIDGAERDLHRETGRMLKYIGQAYSDFRQCFHAGRTAELFSGFKREYLDAQLFYGEWRPFLYLGNRVEARLYDVDAYGYLLLEKRDGICIRCGIKELRYLFA